MENIKVMTSHLGASHAHFRSYVSHSTSKRSHKNVTSCLSVIRYSLDLCFVTVSLKIKNIIFCGGKYRHNSVENDYCGGNLIGFVVSALGLVGSVGLPSLGLWLRVRVSVSISV